VTEEGYPPRQPHYPGRPGPSRSARPAGRPRPREPRRTGWQVIDAFDDRSDQESDLPPWAGPGAVVPRRPARRPPRVPVPEPRTGVGRPGGPGLQDPRRYEPDGYEPDRYEPGLDEPGLDEPGLDVPSVDELDDERRVSPDGPERTRRRPGRSRAAAARRRRSKRRLVTWGSAALVAVVIAGGVLLITRSPAPKSRFVTTLQRGELRAVPDACKVLGAAALRQLMGGTPKMIQPQQGQAQSECSYTVDAKPTFRVVNVDLQAMRANLVAVGNGSATADARYSFGAQRIQLAKPSKRTPQPPATITAVPGLGDQAFSAVQAFRPDGTTAKGATDLVTVVARYRNVLITVSFQGQNGQGFGPVSVVALRSAALNVARAALVRVKAQPTV
jgi:hypothetical protein